MSNQYELVGHSFTTLSNSLHVLRHFAFSISLTLTTGSKWIAYYHWMDGRPERTPQSLWKSGKLTKIASGLGRAPIKFESNEGWPKDVIKGEPTARLNYIRFTTGDVLVRLDVTGQKPRIMLEFIMAEPQPQPKHGHEESGWDGFIVLWPADSEKDGRKQVLGTGAWCNATNSLWQADL